MTVHKETVNAVWAGLFAAVGCVEVMAGEFDATCPQCTQSRTEKIDSAILFDETVANTAEILEPDWELLLRRRAEEAGKAGLLRQAQQRTELNLRRHAVRPVDLKLPKAQEPRTRRTVILDEQTVSHMAVPVKAVLSGFARTYVFFDADDPVQRAYVKSLPGIGSQIRPVATAGNLAEASQATGLRLYADQGGSLTRRFDLQAVPSLVRLTFNGSEVFARIDEIVLDDEGREIEIKKEDLKATP